eukprot:jgi/Galph1/1410/GphlegSOOS_G104.1
MTETVSRVRALTEKGTKLEGQVLLLGIEERLLPILVELCEKNAFPNGFALVPGCGRGYDVLTLATESRTAIGIDCSEEAKKQAEQLRDARGVPAERAQFFVGNFFDFPFEQKVIYDLTFFCALAPEYRSLWAQRMRSIIRQDGELATVVFPIGEYEGGPPYAMSLDIILNRLVLKASLRRYKVINFPPSSIS